MEHRTVNRVDGESRVGIASVGNHVCRELLYRHTAVVCYGLQETDI